MLCAVIAKPKILILYEHTSGLDPIMQEKFNLFMKELKKRCTRIVLFSHIFKENSRLCDRVIFLNYGSRVKKMVLEETNRKNLELEFINTFWNEGENLEGILKSDGRI